jgi:hypothetical protein
MTAPAGRFQSDSGAGAVFASLVAPSADATILGPQEQIWPPATLPAVAGLVFALYLALILNESFD